jgi:hypothetical protein
MGYRLELGTEASSAAAAVVGAAFTRTSVNNLENLLTRHQEYQTGLNSLAASLA